MNIRLEKAVMKEQLDKIEKLYMEAFPASERKPFNVILQKCSEGFANIFAIEDEAGNFAGEVITMEYKDIVLLDYFAIDEKLRGMGAGSKTLKLLQEKYSDKRFMLEIESTLIESDDKAERLKRKHFYIINGMKPMDYEVDLLGVRMEIMTFNCHVRFEEYHEIFENILGNSIADRVKLI